MTKEELINDYLEEIRFRTAGLKALLSESGIQSNIKKLAVRINIARIKYLKAEIKKLENEK